MTDGAKGPAKRIGDGGERGRGSVARAIAGTPVRH